MEQHGGRIGVHSDGLGLGSTFFIEIPLVLTEEDFICDHDHHKQWNDICEEEEVEDAEDNITNHHDDILSTSTRRRSSVLSVHGTRRSSVVPSTALGILDRGQQLMDKTFGSIVENSEKSFVENDGIVRRFTESSIVPSPRKIKALIVDDSYLNRKMIARLLQQRSFVIYEACDGAEAVDCVSASIESRSIDPTVTFDVLVMDFVMPTMDGPTATKQIRALGYRGVIIGVTGNALPDDISTFLASGADAVMTKPINIETFIREFSGNYF